MILQTQCNHCGKTIRFHSFATDRLELSQLKKFTQLDLKCKKCGTVDRYDINKIKANSKLFKIVFISLLTIYILLIPAILTQLWDTIWKIRNVYQGGTLIFLILLPIAIYVMVNNSIESSQSRFNSRKI